MKSIRAIAAALFLASCNFQNITVTGTAPGMDSGAISIIDPSGKTLFAANITSGKFEIKQQPLPAAGYYTLSIMSGPYPHDYEVYLEPGGYIVDVAKNEGDYLKIKTESQTQNNLSAYYNFEDSVMSGYRKERDMWNAKLNDPNAKALPEKEINNIIDKVNSYRNREHGMHIAAMDMFIKKYPESDIVPHIMTNLDYSSDAYAYYSLFNKLKPHAKATEEGKQVGGQLQRLVRQADQANNNTSPHPPAK